MPARSVFLDTSFIVALENRDDAHHERAKELDRELVEQNAALHLHLGVVYEIADGYARFGRRYKGIELVSRLCEETGYLVHPLDDLLVRQATQLYASRPDKEWSLTDCTSFALMEREAISEALTADVHFRQAGF